MMRCPVDGTPLALADHAGVEIDYCPQCRGIWLDRGELDRIIERSGPGHYPSRDDHDHRHDDDHDRRHHDHHDDDQRYSSRGRKRGGVLGGLAGLLGGGED